MDKPTYTTADLATFCQLDELGLTVTGQHLEPNAAHLRCRMAKFDPHCPKCHTRALSCGTRARRLAHIPFGSRKTIIDLRVRRFKCPDCEHFWIEDTTSVADPKNLLTRGAIIWALTQVVIARTSIAHIAHTLGVSWHTANTAIVTYGRHLLLNDNSRLDGVTTIGVDEHVWRRSKGNKRFVTVIIDLTPNASGKPSRLLDIVEGRSKQAFQQWLSKRPKAWQEAIKLVAMDGFVGYKTAVKDELPNAQVVMDPFHVVQLVGRALSECRRRVQRQVHGRRGHKDDPLYRTRKTLLTCEQDLNEWQWEKVCAVLDNEDYLDVHVTWSVYQKVIAAYRVPCRKRGRQLMQEVIEGLVGDVPKSLEELKRVGVSLLQRQGDILAYFDHPGSSNGPTEAINGRIEHLRGIAHGFRSFDNYLVRCLLHSGGFREQLHP